jgi:hypothetical protein
MSDLPPVIGLLVNENTIALIIVLVCLFSKVINVKEDPPQVLRFVEN